jgi:uncharacterized protein
MQALIDSLPSVLFLIAIAALYKMQAKGVSFNKRTLAGLLIGMVIGLGSHALSQNNVIANMYLNHRVFDLAGTIYLGLLQMLVIPLILTSIISAILNLGEAGGPILRFVTIRAILMLLALTAVSALIGIGIGGLFHVGSGLSMPTGVEHTTPPYAGIVATIKGMIPINPVAIMAHGNTIAMAIFATLLGMGALHLYQQNPKQAQPFKDVMLSGFHIVKQLARIIIALTPYGVLAMMAETASAKGFITFLSLLNYVFAMYAACMAVMGLHTIILISKKVNPISYFKHAYLPLLVAFTTRSSYGTLSVAEETLKDKFKVHQVTASFVPSIGATMGMNACAGIFPAMLVMMTMHITGQSITWPMMLMVMLANSIASLGISGIPGTAYIAAGVSLSMLGLPYEVIGIVIGIDAIVDMARTATNVNGVLTTAIVIDKSMATQNIAMTEPLIVTP